MPLERWQVGLNKAGMCSVSMELQGIVGKHLAELVEEKGSVNLYGSLGAKY